MNSVYVHWERKFKILENHPCLKRCLRDIKEVDTCFLTTLGRLCGTRRSSTKTEALVTFRRLQRWAEVGGDPTSTHTMSIVFVPAEPETHFRGSVPSAFCFKPKESLNYPICGLGTNHRFRPTLEMLSGWMCLLWSLNQRQKGCQLHQVEKRASLKRPVRDWRPLWALFAFYSWGTFLSLAI